MPLYVTNSNVIVIYWAKKSWRCSKLSAILFWRKGGLNDRCCWEGWGASDIPNICTILVLMKTMFPVYYGPCFNDTVYSIQSQLTVHCSSHVTVMFMGYMFFIFYIHTPPNIFLRFIMIHYAKH